ncbi:MAG: type I secretion system permease/ATPase [Lautropia sp.]
MKPYLGPLYRVLAGIALISVALNLLLLVPALFMLQVYDRVLASGSQETLLMLLLGAAIALGLYWIFDHLRNRLQAVAGLYVGESLSPRVARALIEQASASIGQPSAEGLRDIGLVRNCFTTQGLLALFDAPWLAVYVAIIWLCHPTLGMAAAGAAVLMLLLAWIIERSARDDVEAIRREAASTGRYLETSLGNAEVIQAMGMAPGLLARWHVMSGRLAVLQAESGRLSIALSALVRTLRQAIQIGMLGLGAWLVLRHEVTAGVMIATTILLSRALAPVEQIVGSWRILSEGQAAWQRLKRVLGAVPSGPPPMVLPAPTGRLVATGIVYRGQRDRVILNGVNLALEPGQALAIIGPSASGKSTLARLLVGLWRPAQGTVRLDGVDLAQWSRDAVGPYIGYLPQDVELFGGTVAENIARLGPVDAEAVVRAAQRAHVHDLILALPNGYDSAIGELGVMLSPGQRQRIALARALYGTPKLVILDEPNANLDGAGELALADTLKGLKALGVTTVVITHRTALITHVDRLMVLEQGRVRHFGPTAEVLAAMRPAQDPEQQVVPIRA